MNEKSKKFRLPRKWKKITFLIIGISFVLLIGKITLNKVVQSKVTKNIEQLSPIARISFSSIKVHLLPPSVSINDLAIEYSPDTANKRHKHFLNFRKAKLAGIDFLKLVFDNELLADRLLLGKGEIKIDQYLIDKKNSKQYDLSRLIPFENISLELLEIGESNVWIHSSEGDKLLLKGAISVDNIEITNLNGGSAKNNFRFGLIRGNFREINYTVPGSYQRLQIKEVSIDSKKGMLRIDSLKISTKYSKLEFGKRLGHQADYVEATSSTIEIRKLNIGQLLDKKLIADDIVINKTKVYVFRDRRLPRKLKEQPMPNGYLKEIPLEVRVNSFRLNNATVVSEEFPKVGEETGSLKIDNINLSMSPVINHPGEADPAYSTTHMEGSIMNAGIISAAIRSPLRQEIYNIKGAIKNLDLPKLNPSSENLGRFHIESGILNNLDFQFTATEKKATGNIVGEYHNLVIERLKEKDGEKKVAKIPTYFLKHLIIPRNKDKSMEISKRTGKIDFERDPTRIVTFYFLKALLDGIRSSFDLGFLLPK